MIAQFPAKGSLLCLDLSKRRIGIAACDADRLLVTPLFTLVRTRWARDLEELRRLCVERRIEGLVLGLPVCLDGTEGRAAQSMRDSAAFLGAGLALPVMLQDESLTTAEIEERVSEGTLPAPRAGEPKDHLAAAIILEDALRTLLRTELKAEPRQ